MSQDFMRRLKKGGCAGAIASSATKTAVGANFKDKYAPDFPRAYAFVGRGAVTAGRPRSGLDMPATGRARLEPDAKDCGAGERRVIHRLRDGSEALIWDVDASA